MNAKEKLTYYNGIMWRTVISEGRARVTKPQRWDSRGAVPTPGVIARHRVSDPAG